MKEGTERKEMVTKAYVFSEEMLENDVTSLKEEGTPDVSRLPCKTIRGVHVETTTQTCLQATCNKQYDSYLHLLCATRYFLSWRAEGESRMPYGTALARTL